MLAAFARGATPALAAALFGAAMGAALAPIDAWWFAPLCLAGLFRLLHRAPPGRRFATGFAFGCGWFVVGLWWVVPGLRLSSDAGPALSLAMGALLVAWCALFSGLGALLAGSAHARPAWLSVAVTAAGWTLAEWLRGHVGPGMPMLPSGLVHVEGPLAGFVPLAGVHGAGYAGAACAAALAVVAARERPDVRGLATAATFVGIVAGAGALLRMATYTAPAGPPLVVRLVNTDVAQQGKFDLRAELLMQQRYRALVAESPAALTVLPETAVATDWDKLPAPMLQAWRDAAGRRAVLLGAFAGRAARPGLVGDGSNSMIGIGAVNYRYDKVHLVPLGELLPSSLAWLGERLAVQYGALVPGEPRQPPMAVGGATIGVSICYENQFEDYLAQQARRASLLLVASNFAWGEGSYAAWQHLQATRMRALETGRWVMQASNGGVTALVDPAGRVAAQRPPGSAGLLDVRAVPMRGWTPFVRFGSTPVLLLCALALGAGCVTAWRHRRAAAVRHRFTSSTAR